MTHDYIMQMVDKMMCYTPSWVTHDDVVDTMMWYTRQPMSIISNVQVVDAMM